MTAPRAGAEVGAMTKLDETGLRAARKAFLHSTGSDPLLGALTAYLDATRTSDALRDLQRLGQECEPDRIAVVVSAINGIGDDATVSWVLPPGTTECDEGSWLEMEEEATKRCGPLARQIVRCHLRRPEPVAEVVGSVEG